MKKKKSLRTKRKKMETLNRLIEFNPEDDIPEDNIYNNLNNTPSDSWKTWGVFAIILLILIFILIGFLIGYSFNITNSCIQDPLTYGIKELNKLNHVDFSCSCFEPQGKVNGFTFTEKGINLNI